MIPKLIVGANHADARGKLTFNNAVDLTAVKRMYTIENINSSFIRGWQGHKIEQRWFAAVTGRFTVWAIYIGDEEWEKPEVNLIPEKFVLDCKTLNVLHVPAGCITAIRAEEPNSKLLALGDYLLGEVNDEFRYPLEYFVNLK